MPIVRRPILRYHGGKWILAKRIIDHFPPHKVYTEVFGGAFSVGLLKPRSYGEVYNDKWGLVVNVFRVLRDPEMAAELRRRIELTPFARDEFDMCTHDDIANHDDPVERARMTIFRSFAGFGSASVNGKHATGFRSNVNRSGSTPPIDWSRYPKEIPLFVKRLQGVVIENKDYWEVLKQHDSPETLNYIDPPYLFDERNMKRGNSMYACELVESTRENVNKSADIPKHILLSERVKSLKGMVIISGYGCKLYDEDLYPGWERRELKTYADGARPRTEVLWLNPAASKANQNQLLPL